MIKPEEVREEAHYRLVKIEGKWVPKSSMQDLANFLRSNPYQDLIDWLHTEQGIYSEVLQDSHSNIVQTNYIRGRIQGFMDVEAQFIRKLNLKLIDKEKRKEDALDKSETDSPSS